MDTISWLPWAGKPEGHNVGQLIFCTLGAYSQCFKCDFVCTCERPLHTAYVVVYMNFNAEIYMWFYYDLLKEYT